MLLAVGAMVLLSTTLLNFNQSNFDSNMALIDSKSKILAVSLANSFIEEATGKSFDVATVNNSVTQLDQLSNIGKSSNESYPHFNDFDDYDGLELTVNSLPAAEFTIQCKVDYIDPSNPNVPASGKTWHKKITVSVFSDAMRDTVKMSQIFSCFYFR